MNIPTSLNTGPTEPIPDVGEAIERPRVLVVDDDPRNLLAMENVLEDVGEVVRASSGEEALRHLLKGEFAVILLDVYMPGMDGYETAHIIRSREQTKRIPIVFLSAVNKEAEHLLRGYAMGAVDYVFKPVDAIVLRSKIAVFVDLFAKTKEIERKARAEQELMDATIRANAERLRAEQELRRAELREAAVIQSLPIILYLEPAESDAERQPRFVSGDVVAMTGFTAEEAAADSSLWLDRIHPADRDRVAAERAARGASGRFSSEYRWRTADGKWKWFHDQAVLLKDAGSGRAEFAGTLTDITERRSLETQLLQAQKMDAIGKLTGGIAHDFNNLLAAVIGGLGLLERRAELSDEHRQILAMTRRAADQGSELVRRLLAFARRQQLQPALIDLSALHSGVDELLRHTLGGLVDLRWRLPENPWPAFADRTQLELALVNLVINARDAMPSGGTIDIHIEHSAVADGEEGGLQPGDYLQFTVVDQGIGIPPDLLDKVMEPFFTTKEVGKGTGLGLPMVYGFSKQSNGAFRLRSEVGGGTRAELWIPRAPDNIVATPTLPCCERSGPARALKILLVDDHPGVRSVTAGMLEDLGHQVIQAGNGAQALDMLVDTNPDVLVTDYAMPQMTGLSLIGQARERCPDLSAMIMTGYADADDIGERPADIQLLLKPFDLNGLSQAIEASADRSDTTTG